VTFPSGCLSASGFAVLLLRPSAEVPQLRSRLLDRLFLNCRLAPARRFSRLDARAAIVAGGPCATGSQSFSAAIGGELVGVHEVRKKPTISTVRALLMAQEYLPTAVGWGRSCLKSFRSPDQLKKRYLRDCFGVFARAYERRTRVADKVLRRLGGVMRYACVLWGTSSHHGLER